MLGFIGNIGPWELVLILVIALIIFGPGKLPEVAKSLGKAVNQFKNASSGLQKEFQEAIRDTEQTVQPAKNNISAPETEKETDHSGPEIIKAANSTETRAAQESKE